MDSFDLTMDRISIECVDNADGYPGEIVYGDETFPLSFQQDAMERTASGDEPGPHNLQEEEEEDSDEDDLRPPQPSSISINLQIAWFFIIIIIYIIILLSCLIRFYAANSIHTIVIRFYAANSIHTIVIRFIYYY